MRRISLAVAVLLFLLAFSVSPPHRTTSTQVRDAIGLAPVLDLVLPRVAIAQVLDTTVPRGSQAVTASSSTIETATDTVVTASADHHPFLITALVVIVVAICVIGYFAFRQPKDPDNYGSTYNTADENRSRDRPR